MATKRRTEDELIEALNAKIKALKAAKKAKLKGTSKVITKDSEGIAALSAALDAVAFAHKITLPNAIRVIARIRRAGLKIAE
jgi:hypothetical protein